MSDVLFDDEEEFLSLFDLIDSEQGGALAYFEWAAADDAKITSLRDMAGANPAWGAPRPTALNLDIIRTERSMLTDEEFARERYGIVDLELGKSAKVSARDWKLCIDPAIVAARTAGKEIEPDPGWMLNPMSFGIDMTPEREWTSIGAAGDCRTGGIAVEVVEHRLRSDWVVEWAKERDEMHGPKWWVIDPRSAAGSLIVPLRNEGLNVIEASTTKHVQAAGLLFDLITAHLLRHRDEVELNAAVAGAGSRPVGDAWLWDRRGSGVVISPFVAVGLAVYGHFLPPEEEEGEDIAVST